jgi:hypothetical protein
MNATKGYYCLVQYCPDIARAEAANVGVVLFSPEHKFIRARMSESIRRIRRFFGEDVEGYHHLNAMKEALAKRLEVEKADFLTLDDLQNFVGTRANKVILTQPKPLKVFDPQQDLEALFKELVLEPAKPLTLQATVPLRERLDDVLLEQSVSKFVRRRLQVAIPNMKETLRIPYGFQNGRMNLIRPIEFKHQFDTSVRTAACKFGMEGLTLYNHPDPALGPLQMIVVADFASAPLDSTEMVKNIFAESQVCMFTSDALETLKQEILTNAKPVENP